MVVVVVVPVHYADAKGMGVAEGAIIDPRQVQVLGKTVIALSFEDRIELQQVFAQKVPLLHIVERLFPQGVFTILIQYGNGVGEVGEVVIGNRKRYFAAVGFEIPAERGADGKEYFFPRWLLDSVLHETKITIAKQKLMDFTVAGNVRSGSVAPDNLLLPANGFHTS